MSTTASHAGRADFHTVREAAWILGVEQSWICRAIRTGAIPVVRRRSRLVVPSGALRLLLVGAP